MSLDHNFHFIFGKKMKSRLINMSDRSIYVSNSVLENLHSGTKSIKHKVVYNGIKSRMRLLPTLKRNSEPIFGIVGILDSGKRQDIAIEYFNKLLLYYPSAKLYIFGDKNGFFKNKLFKLVDDLNLKRKDSV